MSIALHPEAVIQKLAIGREQAPLVVIDNFLADAESLVDQAAGKPFGDVTSYYPGIRAKVSLLYQQFVIAQLRGLIAEYFGLPGQSLRFTSCHYSIVTTPPEKLLHLQRIPHIDSTQGNELAFIHYLFRKDHGGTAFYRHRRTGFEFIDQERRSEYFAIVEQERDGPDSPAHTYINGDTALYEQVGRQDGVFNRMLIYRRNSLHSGCIGREFSADPNPRKGRLSINGFLA